MKKIDGEVKIAVFFIVKISLPVRRLKLPLHIESTAARIYLQSTNSDLTVQIRK